MPATGASAPVPLPPEARILGVASVATSLVLQAPVIWDEWASASARIVFASATDGFEARLARWGPHVEIPFTRSPTCVARPGLWRDVRRLLRRPWHLVQVQSPIAGAVVRTALPRSRSYPVVYVAHGFHFHRDGRPLTNLLYRTIEESLAWRADAVMLVSGEDFEAARSGPIARRTRIYRLPGAGIDVERFATAPRQRPFPEEALLALVCGELAPEKNPIAAVEAVLDARERGRDVRLIVAGDGILRPRLERYLRRPGAETWLRHLPFSDDVPSLMKGADVLLAPSSREGLPRVLVEALAAGLPIVSVANRGSRELLAGGLGRLVRLDVRAMGDALRSFDRADFPSAAEMRRLADAYSSDRVAAAYRAAIADLFS